MVETVTIENAHETQYGMKADVDSPYEAKGTIKGLDWETSHRQWDGGKDAWVLDVDAVGQLAERLQADGFTVKMTESVKRAIGDLDGDDLHSGEFPITSGKEDVTAARGELNNSFILRREHMIDAKAERNIKFHQRPAKIRIQTAPTARDSEYDEEQDVVIEPGGWATFERDGNKFRVKLFGVEEKGKQHERDGHTLHVAVDHFRDDEWVEIIHVGGESGGEDFKADISYRFAFEGFADDGSNDAELVADGSLSREEWIDLVPLTERKAEALWRRHVEQQGRQEAAEAMDCSASNVDNLERSARSQIVSAKNLVSLADMIDAAPDDPILGTCAECNEPAAALIPEDGSSPSDSRMLCEECADE